MAFLGTETLPERLFILAYAPRQTPRRSNFNPVRVHCNSYGRSVRIVPMNQRIGKHFPEGFPWYLNSFFPIETCYLFIALILLVFRKELLYATLHSQELVSLFRTPYHQSNCARISMIKYLFWTFYHGNAFQGDSPITCHMPWKPYRLLSPTASASHCIKTAIPQSGKNRT